MAEQEHTAGRDGEPRQTGSAGSADQGGSAQPGRRHSWGSKSGSKASHGPSSADNDGAGDPQERRDTGGSGDGSAASASAGHESSDGDRRAPRSEGGSRASSSGGRPPAGRPAWKGQSESSGTNRRSGGNRGSERPERDGRDARGDRPGYTRDAGPGQERAGGTGQRGNDRTGQGSGRPAPRSSDRPQKGSDGGRGAQLRGSASRGGSASGYAADKQNRSADRSGGPTDRAGDGRERPWQPRSASGEGRSGGDRRAPERSNSFRRPSDRHDRGAGREQRTDDRRYGNAQEDAASTGPRPHNARDLRSANRPDRERSPEIDDDVKGDELDRVTRAQVRNLEERSAVWVAKHLVMAGRLIDLDPELAFQHALAASRRGGRLAAVREAVGLTAYAAGHYGEALREFRTFRRISGSNVHLPVMADCERGLGRPDRALDLARSEEAETLDAAGKAELAMVVSGARADLGQLEAAVVALEIPQLDLHRAFSFSPRLFRAYAEALDAVGRGDESGPWRRQAGVAEKALGLEDDLEPDIIDLGDDDDPAPAPVPKVADILGGAAAGPAADAAVHEQAQAPDLEEPAPEGAASDAQAGPAETEPAATETELVATETELVATETELVATETELVATETETAEAETESVAAEIEPAAAETEAELDTGAEQVLPVPADEPRQEVPGTPDAKNARDANAHAAGAGAADAAPVGDGGEPVQPLQTEMLFSMDDSGTSDIVVAPGAAPVSDSVPSTSSAVEFSEAGSSPRKAGAGSGTGGAAARKQAGPSGEEPTRDETDAAAESTRTESQEDVVDE